MLIEETNATQENLRNHKGEVIYIFSTHVATKDSNEAEVLTILEALCIYRSSYHQSLIVESTQLMPFIG